MNRYSIYFPLDKNSHLRLDFKVSQRKNFRTRRERHLGYRETPSAGAWIDLSRLEDVEWTRVSDPKNRGRRRTDEWGSWASTPFSVHPSDKGPYVKVTEVDCSVDCLVEEIASVF